jgi:hypothetical protein
VRLKTNKQTNNQDMLLPCDFTERKKQTNKQTKQKTTTTKKKTGVLLINEIRVMWTR